MRDGRFVLDVAASGSVSRDAGTEQTVYVLHWSPTGRFATRSRRRSPGSHFFCRARGREYSKVRGRGERVRGKSVGENLGLG